MVGVGVGLRCKQIGWKSPHQESGPTAGAAVVEAEESSSEHVDWFLLIFRRTCAVEWCVRGGKVSF